MEKSLFEQLNDRINLLNSSEELQSEFTSTSLKDDKRVYHLLNTNIKTLNTYYKYLYDIINYPDKDNHQKYEVVRKLGLYSSDKNAPNIQKINTRASILLETGKIFPHKSSLVRNILIFILSLRSDYNAVKGSEYLLDSLPKKLLDEYELYLGQLLSDSPSDIRNPAFGVFVFYSDRELLDIYLDLFDSRVDAFETIISALNERDFNFVSKRIKNCQKSSLKMEAFLFAVYRVLNELELTDSYNQNVEALIQALQTMLTTIGSHNLGSLLIYDDSDFDALRSLLLALNQDQRIELNKCLSFESDSVNIRTIKTVNTLVQNDYEGSDVQVTTSHRRGQNVFKRELQKVSRINGTLKCFFPGCDVEGEKFLIASHIVPWKYSDNKEKVDPNNGLLLCPNHDLLFDSLLITFNKDGKLVVSEDLLKTNIGAFGIKDDLLLDLSPEKEVYMCRHRNAMKKKRWKK